jgi:uncharacterized protein YoxC
MNIKTIVLSTGLSFLFSIYSVYNIVNLLKEITHSNKTIIDNKQKLEEKIEEIIDKYNKLEDEIKHKNDEINKLTEKIDNVEKRIEQMSHSYFEFSVNNMYETSEEEEKDILTEEIQITEFNHNEPLEPIIKLPERNTLIEHFDEQNEYNCVVIENINNVTQLSASFCSNSNGNSKNNINSNFEKDDIRSRSRSNSFTDIIRSGHGLATKFFFG